MCGGKRIKVYLRTGRLIGVGGENAPVEQGSCEGEHEQQIGQIGTGQPVCGPVARAHRIRQPLLRLIHKRAAAAQQPVRLQHRLLGRIETRRRLVFRQRLLRQ